MSGSGCWRDWASCWTASTSSSSGWPIRWSPRTSRSVPRCRNWSRPPRSSVRCAAPRCWGRWGTGSAAAGSSGWTCGCSWSSRCCAPCTLAWDAWSPAAFRFALGPAVGLDHPIAAGCLAEILPSKNRGRRLVGAFSLQAAGILLGAVVGVVVLNVRPEVDSWRIMLRFGVLPALLIIWLRRAVPESPRWLARKGHEEEACEIGRALAGGPVTVTGADRERQEGRSPARSASW
ncbi:MFS transporter [Streptomyces sp. AK02-04a]|nr:MFS transporter [Streptomyces sp. AK02-04a]